MVSVYELLEIDQSPRITRMRDFFSRYGLEDPLRLP